MDPCGKEFLNNSLTVTGYMEISMDPGGKEFLNYSLTVIHEPLW